MCMSRGILEQQLSDLHDMSSDKLDFFLRSTQHKGSSDSVVVCSEKAVPHVMIRSPESSPPVLYDDFGSIDDHIGT